MTVSRGIRVTAATSSTVAMVTTRWRSTERTSVSSSTCPPMAVGCGSRVTFGGIVMDLAGIEEVDLSALGGADRLNVNDLSGTGLTEIQTDLAGPPRRPRRWSCGSGHRE